MLLNTELFNTPFAVYTDPTLQVYRALGMTLQTLDPGPEADRGDYVRPNRSLEISTEAMGMDTALERETEMPTDLVSGSESKAVCGGDITQLGGEFVFGPGYVSAL